MKVSELIGARLDYWVAKANGDHAYIRRERITMNNEDGSLCRVLVDEDRCFRKRDADGECTGGFWLGYSRKWELGGPIIEREEIELSHDRGWREDGEFGRVWQGHDAGYGYLDGDTPLIAAMRAFVAGKYGATVPDEE